jgi:hypothetical protein
MQREEEQRVNAENFPVFPAGDGTSYTIRRDLLRYSVLHIVPAGATATPTVLPVGETFESRHAAVAAAINSARLRRAG